MKRALQLRGSEPAIGSAHAADTRLEETSSSGDKGGRQPELGLVMG